MLVRDILWLWLKGFAVWKPKVRTSAINSRGRKTMWIDKSQSWIRRGPAKIFSRWTRMFNVESSPVIAILQILQNLAQPVQTPCQDVVINPLADRSPLVGSLAATSTLASLGMPRIRVANIFNTTVSLPGSLDELVIHLENRLPRDRDVGFANRGSFSILFWTWTRTCGDTMPL